MVFHFQIKSAEQYYSTSGVNINSHLNYFIVRQNFFNLQHCTKKKSQTFRFSQKLLVYFCLCEGEQAGPDRAGGESDEPHLGEGNEKSQGGPLPFSPLLR
jgi:hypothetical protein